MTDAMIHPTPQELAAFGLGKLAERAAAVIAAHLESCTTCRQAVASVSADSFLGKVRDAGIDGSSFVASYAGLAAIPTAPTPNIPAELARHEKYLVLRQLGRGGMGVVYQGRHKEMDRQVVIKVISRSLLDRPDSLERFRREIRAAAQLSHPNIVTAYDAEQAGELHMLVMEFVPGRNLAEVVRLKGPLPISVACHFARQVALGLQHAYERNLVHRDIKPQNLMLTPKGQVKILDFGLAKVVREEKKSSGLTSDNTYLGTPDYCAPEQALDASEADIRADLYSLGCTLYYLLTGCPPFQEDTAIKTILAHQQMEPQPLPDVRPEVPAELWQIVARLLAKDPAKRYEKPSDVAQALYPFIKSGLRQDVKGVLAPGANVSSPRSGTIIAADTGEIKNILRGVPGKKPPKEAPTTKEAALPLAELSNSRDTSKRIVRVRGEAQPYLSEWWKRPGVLAAAVSISLALILMAAVIVMVRTPHGTIVLEDLPPDAEVTVDGGRVTVKWVDAKTAEIRVGAGKKHQLVVQKVGFRVWGEEVEIDAGGRRPIRVRYKPLAAQADNRPPPAPDPPRNGKEKDGKQIKEKSGQTAKSQVESLEALTPVQAARRIGHRVTVEYRVLSTGYNTSGFDELYSEKAWHTAGCFFIRIPYALREKYRELGISNVGFYYLGKLIRVNGTVTTFRFGASTFPCIRIDALDQILVPNLREPGKGGSVQLFNGKDLTGWKTHPILPGHWRVEKGVLIGSGDVTSYLYTERGDYQDFNLHVEARVSEHGNSGIVFRSPFGPVQKEIPTTPGYQAEITDWTWKTGSLIEISMEGKPTPLVAIGKSSVAPGEWFKLEVIAEGNHLVVMVNDKTTADYTDEKRRFSRGHIALEKWAPQTVCEFRKIEIKESK